LALHSKSFSLAGKLLPREARGDAAVLYAWCRRADDAVDTGPNETRRERLDDLRSRGWWA
jgi:phytoene synthase